MPLTTADVPGRVCTHYPITGFSHSIQTSKYLPFTNLPNLLCPVPLSAVSLLQLAIPPKRQPIFSTMPTMNGLKPYYQTQPFHVRSWRHLLFSTDTAIACHQWWLLPGGFRWHTQETAEEISKLQKLKMPVQPHWALQSAQEVSGVILPSLL